MGVLAVTNAFIYGGSHDFTGDSTEWGLEGEGDAQDATTFRSAGWKESTLGLRATKLTGKGWWQAGTGAVDPDVFNNLGASQVFTAGNAETEGQPAAMFQAAHFNYQVFGQLGDTAPFAVTAQGTDGVGVVRGQLAKAKGNVAATGQLGSILTLTAPTSTQYVYCTVHVFSAGTTVTLQLQSDDAVGFPSASTRATIGPLTTAGGTWMTRVAGPLAGEAYWRLNVSAITGTFSVAAAIGIQ